MSNAWLTATLRVERFLPVTFPGLWVLPIELHVWCWVFLGITKAENRTFEAGYRAILMAFDKYVTVG